MFNKNYCVAFNCLLLLLLSSCSISKQVKKSADTNLLNQPGLENAHIGIAVYDVTAEKYWYRHNSNKYFIPASNAKIFTCYAGLKYLGDSLEGIRYTNTTNGIVLQPTGDPTLLHPDFKTQPVIQFLQRSTTPLFISADNWKDEALGFGWAWDDYNSSYMAERSPLPVYGNLVNWIQDIDTTAENISASIYSNPEVNWKVKFNSTSQPRFDVERKKDENVFIITEGKEPHKEIAVPFITNTLNAALELLPDTIGKPITITEEIISPAAFKTIYSQPTDSLLKPMMHSSDNFFAEQVLLMVAAKQLGYMNTAAIIDSLLKTDLKNLPQQPRWADGSGLSRYNLFTPEDFIWILQEIKTNYSWQRITQIFATGNEGTLNNYYKQNAGNVFLKTGTLSGQVALSGYIITNKNKILLVSVLVNNHQTSATKVRRAVEKFIQHIIKNY